MKYFYLTLISIFVSLSGHSQIRGKMVDANNGESLAFVAIYEEGTSAGVYSDIDGNFTINSLKLGAVVIFKFIGYKPMRLSYQGENPWLVKMTPEYGTMKEIVIRPGENPADRIIKRAIENKENNDPEKKYAFTYDSYNKLFFDLLSDTATLTPDLAKDTAFQKDLKDLSTFHLFLVETVSQRKFLPPNNSEETIIANRVSGLKTADFALLGTQLQSFSFYGEYVEILAAKYLSPLSKGSTNKYLFIIEDTNYVNQDTVFTISFRPRKGKNFTGMEGQLFINSDGYALQNVLAKPSESGQGLNIRIQQRYEKIDNKAWFPVQLNSDLELPMLQIPGMKAGGEGRSYMQNIVLNPPLRAREFTPVTLQMDKDAYNKPDSIWAKFRTVDLDSLDLKTYHVIDSLGDAEKLDEKLKIYKSLLLGKIPLGIIDIDLDRIIRFNSYEGFRVGAGIHTSERLSPYYSIGGYGAYGFKDKAWKYGADAKVNLYRKREAWIKALWEVDVRETAGNQFVKPGFGSLITSDYYPLFISRMDQYQKIEGQINGRVWRNFSLNAFGNVQLVKPYQGISYNSTVDANSTQVTVNTTDFSLTELGGTLRWAPGEKLARVGEREIRLFGRLPVFWIKYTKGLSGFMEGEYSYDRIDALIEKKFLIKNLGELSTKLIGGRVNANLPLSLLYNARGSNTNKFNIVTPEGFETMFTNEFQYSEFVAFHLRHNFGHLLFKRPKFRPQLILVHSMLVSSKNKNAQQYSVPIKSAERGFYESGLQIDRLLVSGFSALGVGAFYRYGDYAFEKTSDNIAMKVSASFAF